MHRSCVNSRLKKIICYVFKTAMLLRLSIYGTKHIFKKKTKALGDICIASDRMECSVFKERREREIRKAREVVRYGCVEESKLRMLFLCKNTLITHLHSFPVGYFCGKLGDFMLSDLSGWSCSNPPQPERNSEDVIINDLVIICFSYQVYRVS